MASPIWYNQNLGVKHLPIVKRVPLPFLPDTQKKPGHPLFLLYQDRRVMISNEK